MKELINLSLIETVKAIKSKEVSVKEIIEAYIKQLNKTKKYNMISEELYDETLQKASEIDKKKSEDFKPLEGIPIAVKDIFCTKGNKTTASSKILSNFVSPYESTVTKNLKKAGGIVICKTNMDEFAMGSANDTCFRGKVINPWTDDFSRPLTPGGSSGGSAAIVAASGSCFALGTDTGGSIRQPASFCGNVGLKPTYGRCSRFGIIAFASSLDQAGPITKTVEDAAYALTYMSSWDKNDSTSSKLEMPNLMDNIKKGIKGIKVGVPKEYIVEDMPQEIQELLNSGREWLKSQGAEIIDISLPHTKVALPCYYIIAPAEASANLARYDGVKFGYRAEGNFTDLNDMYCKTRGEGFGKEVKRRLLIGTYVLSSGYYDAYYIHAQKVRRKIVEDFEIAFKDVDVILSPTTPSDAFELGEKKKDPITMYLNDVFTVPSSLAGLPAISIPAGLSKRKKPLGLQLISNKFTEDILLRAAFSLEEAASFNFTPDMDL
ncbi:MAG: Glutamyl-tRNA(Gln) amidotransferase subunit A [Alphaproteobacteria bacterium MarineAlpha9_Bin4]|nr:MAG: Glutamyl-tRNA(Gln) amidotransferase subunit A [Alphaproteobacteria bacterium MarineAlpha9_Bin4]|tara:strand:+ start:425 stop:1897 length:1473 start_codon:yes stop_codon:yes gene_type:complete